MKSYLWYAIGVLGILCSCEPQNQDINISKASTNQFPFAKTKNESLTFIYHYNQQRSKLEWTAVKLKETTGNKLKDAISALLQDFQKSGICKGLELERLSEEKNQATIHLSGHPILISKQDSTIFWSALDLTAKRYTTSNGYQVKFNGLVTTIN